MIMRQKRAFILFVLMLSVCAVFVAGCGKDSTDLAGNKYKAIHNGSVESYVEFKDNGELINTVAEGKYNRGEQAIAKYEIVEANGNKFLLVPYIRYNDFWNGYQVMDFGVKLNDNNKSLHIFLLKEEQGKLYLYQTRSKKDRHNFEITSKDELKNLEGVNSREDVRILEKVE